MLNEVIILSKLNEIDYKYVLRRWYIFKISIYCENVFVKCGTKKKTILKIK